MPEKNQEQGKLPKLTRKSCAAATATTANVNAGKRLILLDYKSPLTNTSTKALATAYGCFLPSCSPQQLWL